jgi:hypothetical protein
MILFQNIVPLSAGKPRRKIRSFNIAFENRSINAFMNSGIDAGNSSIDRRFRIHI